MPGSARGAGLIGLQFAGTEDSAGWAVAAYGRNNLWSGYWWHAGFLVCLSLGLAVLARWGGRNYRTVSTRRLSRPLAWAAIGALALAAIGHLLLWLGLDQRVDGVWPYVAVTDLGHVADLRPGGGVRRGRRARPAAPRFGLDVLREADDDGRGESTDGEAHDLQEESRFGLAFSGGGVRAASISLGALQGLERDGRMGWGLRRPHHLGVRRLVHGRRLEPGPQHGPQPVSPPRSPA